MQFRNLAFGAGCLLALMACGLDTGGALDEPSADGGDVASHDGSTLGADGGVSFDASTDGASGMDAATGVDSASGSDAANGIDSGPSPDASPPPPPDACAPSPEICNDGVDNDCNGLIDCADPACSAKTTCEPPVVSGWTVVAFNAAATPPCPPGYGAPTDAVSLTAPPPPATCGCSCSLQDPPSCVSGNVSLYASSQQQCPPTSLPVTNNNGQCNDLPIALASYPGAGARVTPLAPSGGACRPAPTSPPPPPPSEARGRVCTLQGSPGGGCSGGGACDPVVPNGFAICVERAGDVACPSGYPNKTLVGTSVSDTRTCSGPCTCGAPAGDCNNAKLAFFAMPGCKGHELDLVADDNCNAVVDTPNQKYASTQYSAAVANAACGNPTSTPTPSGSVTLQSPRSVCCP